MRDATPAAPMKKTGAELKGRKLIKCPHCRELLMDIGRNDRVELFKLPARKPVRWQKVKQCAVCNSKIGYNKTQETSNSFAITESEQASSLRAHRQRLRRGGYGIPSIFGTLAGRNVYWAKRSGT